MRGGGLVRFTRIVQTQEFIRNWMDPNIVTPDDVPHLFRTLRILDGQELGQLHTYRLQGFRNETWGADVPNTALKVTFSRTGNRIEMLTCTK